MKIKENLKVIGLLTVSVLILAGCGQNKSGNSNSSTSSHKVSQTADNSKKAQKKESTKSSSSQENKTALWNDHKDSLLTQFIDQWAPKMNQDYIKYDGKKSLKTSTGTIYPDDLSKVKIDGNKTTIGMSKDGKGNNEYNVVAIYNYDGTEPPLPNHITYVFAFHDDQPVALVDQSRDGDPELKPTQNTEVQSNFEQIVDNNDFTRTDDEEASTESSSNSSQSDSSDDKQTNNKQAKGNSNDVKPITDQSEALSIASSVFNDPALEQSQVVPATRANNDGSYTLIVHAGGGHGIQVYTLTPQADNKVSVHQGIGSDEIGEKRLQDGGTKIASRNQ